MEVGHSFRMGKQGTEAGEEPLQDTKISSSQESQARQMQSAASCLRPRHCIVKEGGVASTRGRC